MTSLPEALAFAMSASPGSSSPRAKMVDGDLSAHVEAQVGGDLFVAAAAGVELEGEGAEALGELR